MCSLSAGDGCGLVWPVMLWMASMKASGLVLTDTSSAHLCRTLYFASAGSFSYAHRHSYSSTDDQAVLSHVSWFGALLCRIVYQ